MARAFNPRGRFCLLQRLKLLHHAFAVDFLGRYENLEADLNKALELAGGGLRVAVPRINVTPAQGIPFVLPHAFHSH